MLFGRLDWHNWNISKGKAITFGVGMVALVGSFVVLGATVIRVRNLQTTISLPKASSAPAWCSQTPPSCCDDIAAGKGYDSCPNYDLRGQCRQDQCNGSRNAPAPRCADASGCDSAGCPSDQCNYPDGHGGTVCRAPNPSKSCACGYAREAWCGSSSCSIPQVVNTSTVLPMVSAQNVVLNPNFTWAYTTPPSGGEAYANVRIFSCQAQTADCMVFAATKAPYYDGVSIVDFYREPGAGKGTTFAADWNGDHVKQLKPNTPYWWQLTWGVASCGVKCVNGIPGDPNYPCGSWGFVTGTSTYTNPGGGGGGAMSCSISLSPTSINTGQSATITMSGTGGTTDAFISRTDTNTLSGFGNPVFTDSQSHKYYKISSNTVSGLPVGDYKIWCHVVASDNSSCSGNPFCDYKGGSVSCSGFSGCNSNNSDYTSLSVTAGAAASCSVSGPTTAIINQAASYSFTYSNAASGQLYWSPTSSASWTTMCNNNTSGGCSNQSITFPSTGTYWVVCDARTNANTGVSGNPFVSYPYTSSAGITYQDGGSASRVQVTVSASVANECEVCGGSGGKTCATGLTCRMAANGSGGVCVKADGSTTCNGCNAGDECYPPLVCAQSGGGSKKCTDPNGAHLACIAGNNGSGACAYKTGAESNADGCTTDAASCTVSTCTGNTQCPDTQQCTNSQQCVDVCPATSDQDVCKTYTASNHACTITNITDGTTCTTADNQAGTCQSGACTVSSSEADACWGNNGTNGRCYDCNGDGVINVLDYSCFIQVWDKNVQ
ncbi:hypothetical protein M1403_03175 [Patescibacteria group bacterium]|nr:hypothetical protein [Patescibacteria group bacterium]